ncbi:response regulator [Streptomyces sp. NPDC048254]|uniref:response regulator n=1 Tax=Streptomyces sp. NPDC048254 TaxID=3365525 RepID=UPI003714B3C5
MGRPVYGSSSSPQPLARGSGQWLLVAAGDPDTADLLTTTLELAGYRTGAAGGGAEVARRLVAQRFDLVVMDAELPGMDDLVTAHAVRGTATAPSCRLAHVGSVSGN